MSSTMSMSMTPTTAGMASMSMMSGMPMASGSVGGMGMGMEMSMNGSMPMTFMASIYTPLWSAAWDPRTTGQYAGTCIFLIFFGAILRALIAVRSRYLDLKMMWKYGRAGGRVYAPPAEKHSKHRWQTSDTMMLAFLDAVLAGVGYLLMIAVMTLNVGYFLSVIAGIFCGSVIFNRYIANPTMIC